MITPTEALLQVAKEHPFRPAVRSACSQWSYAALWARVRQIADKIQDLDDSMNPIGLHMGLEIDYISATQALWLSGRAVVFLSSKWTPDIFEAVLARPHWVRSYLGAPRYQPLLRRPLSRGDTKRWMGSVRHRFRLWTNIVWLIRLVE